MTCSKCKTEVEKYAHGTTCRQCYNTYMREYSLRRYHERRTRALILLGGKCVQCGSEHRLELDHIDPTTKEIDVSKFNVAEDRFWEEVMGKCQLLCRSCHQRKSAQVRAVPHGGGVSGRRNCQCLPCKARKNEYMRNWKQERG